MNAKTCVTKSKFTFEENNEFRSYYLYIINVKRTNYYEFRSKAMITYIFFSFYLLNDLILKEILRITSKLVLISVYFHLYLQKYIDLYTFIYAKHKHEQTYVCIYVWSENIRLPFMRPIFDYSSSSICQEMILDAIQSREATSVYVNVWKVPIKYTMGWTISYALNYVEGAVRCPTIVVLAWSYKSLWPRYWAYWFG